MKVLKVISDKNIIEEDIFALLSEGRPPSKRELLSKLVWPAEEVEPVLVRLLAEGKLVWHREGGGRKQSRLLTPGQLGWYKGRIQGSGKGYAFFIPEDEGASDIFLSASLLHGAMHNDIVLIEVGGKRPEAGREAFRGTKNDYRQKQRGKGGRNIKSAVQERPSGEVRQIIHRANRRVVGTYQKSGKCGLVTPDQKRLGSVITIGPRDNLRAGNGQKVVVEIIAWPKEDLPPQGKVIEILGRISDPNLDILTIIRHYDLAEEFTPAVIAEAQAAAHLTEEDKKGREDWRDQLLVTMDGADARDLDDAVSLSRTDTGNWLLGVHIADVAHYVRPGTLLDKEAKERATSIYFPDRVLPMLPPALSNGICSLNAAEDRLALSCIMEIDQEGRVVRHRIAETIIKVSYRLTYQEVNEGNTPEQLQSLLENYGKLMLILRDRRFADGAIDFNFGETKVIMGENGQVEQIEKREQGFGERIIEEMMIIANRTVATEYYSRQAPFLYRVHEAFRGDKLAEIEPILRRFGYYLPQGERISSARVQRLLEKAAGQPQETLISVLLLRAMSHACYDQRPLGHFALAMPYYSHFTSPIRRYPDLAIHRVIKTYLRLGSLKEETARRWTGEMTDIARHSSARERLAEEAEREAVKAKCCQYLSRRIGEEFSGRITGVNSYGFYVELENSIEGLVHARRLEDDYYHFNEEEFTLVGRRSGKTFALGDEVRVVVAAVDLEQRLIDFSLADEEKGEEIRLF
ncbi:MAG: ribonuclease R [Clostridiales bacterium]|nr:ribonuclease R [Clostridiales bacterium]